MLRVLANGADDCVDQDVLRAYSIEQDVLPDGAVLPTPTMICAASCGAGGAVGVAEGVTFVAGGGGIAAGAILRMMLVPGLAPAGGEGVVAGAIAVGPGTAACRSAYSSLSVLDQLSTCHVPAGESTAPELVYHCRV